MSLLEALQNKGPHPALIAYCTEGRTELSGRVLANWLVKSVNFFRDEIALDSFGVLVIDLEEHWKSMVLALSASLLGVEVLVRPDEVPQGEFVVATDQVDSPRAADASEVLALDPVSLSLRFSGSLSPLDIDWVQAVRSQPDSLTAPLPHIESGAIHEGKTHVLVDSLDADPAPLVAGWLAGACVVGPAGSITAEQLAAEGIRSS